MFSEDVVWGHRVADRAIDIDDPEHAKARYRLHDSLLSEMDGIRDPFRSFRWGDRPWRRVRRAFYHGGARRGRPEGFPFPSTSIEAEGIRSALHRQGAAVDGAGIEALKASIQVRPTDAGRRSPGAGGGTMARWKGSWGVRLRRRRAGW